MAVKDTSGFTNCMPVLPVADLDATFAFYELKLGLLPHWRQGDVLGAVWSGDVVLFLRPAAEGFQPVNLILNAPDADALHARFRDAGVEILEPPTTHPWGMREFVLRELNGHVFRIGHLDESQATYEGFVTYPSEEG